MNIEVRKEELEQLLTSYVESKLEGKVKISGIRFHEKGFHPSKINYDNINYREIATSA
jgi:hypothetical protein